jgi:hypothetical protein
MQDQQREGRPLQRLDDHQSLEGVRIVEKGRSVAPPQHEVIGHDADELMQDEPIHQADQGRRNHHRQHEEGDEPWLPLEQRREKDREAEARRHLDGRDEEAETQGKPRRRPEFTIGKRRRIIAEAGDLGRTDRLEADFGDGINQIQHEREAEQDQQERRQRRDERVALAPHRALARLGVHADRIARRPLSAPKTFPETGRGRTRRLL